MPFPLGREKYTIKGKHSETLTPRKDGDYIKMEIEIYETLEEIRKQIKKCEGKHKQQIAYSSYHDSLTQVCFGCKKVRTNMKL